MDEHNSSTDQQDQEQEANRFNRKQQILESRGKAVGLDLFLYSCLEHERLLQAKGDANPNLISWPRLGSKDKPEVSSEIAGAELQKLLANLIIWYRDTFPALSIRGVIDREILHEVVEPLVSLNLDLSRLYEIKTGEKIPAFDKSGAPKPFWSDLESNFLAQLPQHANMFIRYLQWSHAVEPIQDFEIGDVPPVGRNAPRMPRRDRDDRSTRGTPRTGDRGSAGGRDHRGPKTRESHDQHSRSTKPDRGPRAEKRQHGVGVRDRGNQRGPRRDSNEADPALESAALADVKQAIHKLESDRSLSEVTLSPTNSFYRRIQHQTIVDAGFSSYSVGEGGDRAVKVSRKL